MKYRKFVVPAVLFMSLFLTAGCGGEETSYLESAADEEAFFDTETEKTSEPAREEPETIYVYVCGEVTAPGVYPLSAEARVYEAIEAAGGLTDEASPYALNQAEKLCDGQKLYVPKEGGEAEVSGEAEPDDGLVNINTADRSELMNLPGIGASKADAILSYREENGPFSDIAELKKIAGIKDGVYSKIKDYIKV